MPRSTVFSCFTCLPGHLERIIGKVLGCSVEIVAVLGRGTFNAVFMLELDNGKGKGRKPQDAALRIPFTGDPFSLSAQQATSGYAATLFLSNLGLPVAVAGPVHLAAPSPIPYATRGRSHFTVMPLLFGHGSCFWWNKGTLAAKKALVTELAAALLRLYRHPLDGFGNMTVSSDGVPRVGPLHDGAVAVAIERGLDVGDLSPGPYPTWKEFARSHVRGLLLLYGEHRTYGGQIKVDSERVLEWLDKFEPRVDDAKFYLVHPDMRHPNVLVDSDSGKLKSLVDWDFARTATVQFLAAGFFLPFCEYKYLVKEKGEDEELLAAYVEALRRGGAPELVQYVVPGWEKEDPQAVFEKALCPTVRLHKLTAKHAYSCLRSFCTSMGLSSVLPPPWKRPARSSFSTVSEDGLFTSPSGLSCSWSIKPCWKRPASSASSSSTSDNELFTSSSASSSDSFSASSNSSSASSSSSSYEEEATSQLVDA